MELARAKVGRTDRGEFLGMLRKSPTVRVIARSWRELTGGTRRDRDLTRRTLIACSGGADSCGLVIALAAAVSRPAEIFSIAHIVHDMRSRAESLADRDAAKSLADRVGLPFVEAAVGVRAVKGNAEAAARKLRYEALERLASQAHCPYIAIAHHADDQLETMLMALMRGAGPQGLAGIPRKRKADGAKIIRPCLEVNREALREVCRAARWTWREDATNQDESKLRAAIRHRIIPELERLRPGVSVRASRAATLVKGAAGLVRKRAAGLTTAGGGPFTWPRDELRREPAVVVGEMIKSSAAAVSMGAGRDQVTSRPLERIIRAIKDSSTEPRSFNLGGAQISVTSKLVTIGGKHA